MQRTARLSEKFRSYNQETLLQQDQRVHLSMTTSPSRLLKIHYVLRSLDLALVDKIFITLPLEFKRKHKYSIPIKLLKEFPKIQFLSISQDIGPIIKGISAVEYMRATKGPQSNNDIFIILDDDNCYAVNTIDTLVYYSLINPTSSISGYCLSFSFYGMSNFGYPFASFQSINGDHAFAKQIIEGYIGIAIRGYQVDVELFKAMTRRDLNPELSSCYLSDDLVMSFILSYENTQLLGLEWEYVSDDMYGFIFRKDFHYFEDENALHLKNPDDSTVEESTIVVRYRMCYQIILKYFLDFTKENIPYKNRTEVLQSLYSSFKK